MGKALLMKKNIFENCHFSRVWAQITIFGHIRHFGPQKTVLSFHFGPKNENFKNYFPVFVNLPTRMLYTILELSKCFCKEDNRLFR